MNKRGSFLRNCDAASTGEYNKLWQRANAQNVSFQTLYSDQLRLAINSVDNTKLPCVVNKTY